MNFAGTFDFSHFEADGLSGSSVDVQANSGGLDGAQHSIVVPDAHLLFAGDYKRAGLDLVLSKDGHDHVVQDYFKGHVRAALSSPDGARLSGALVESLTGEVQVAQLSGATAAATVIGRVTKLTGSATAIRNGVSIQLNMGDNVNKGDVVQAGSDSSLGLTFIDGTVFGLSSNARMVLNEMVYDPNGSSNSSLLSLVQGTITFVAGETAKHGNMKVDTPVATMGIRGTAVLVEIDFTVPGTGGAPPVKFQVLVEPGGKTGSYVLYSKSDPSLVIGTVNQAGQVTSVVGDGTSSTAPAPLSPEALAIIPQIFQLYFPGYTPNANPQGTSPNNGSAPANPTPGSSNPDPIKFVPTPDLPVGVPTTIPVNLPPRDAPGTPPILVTVTRFNTAPTIVVAPLAVTLQADGTGFNLTDRVTITDPDIGDGVFNDVAVPYVAGTGRVVSAVGPANLPAGLDLTRLVTVDPQTGAVSYDPAAFRFLGEGQNAVFTISFDSRSGPDTVHESLTFTIEGVNDAPAITRAGLTVAEGGTVLLTAASIGVSDPDSSNFTFKVSGVSHGTFQTSTDGIHWTDATTFTTADLNAGHVRFVHDGGEAAPTFSITADDGASANHLSNTLTGTVDFTAVNDAPVITRASLTVTEGGTVLLTAASIGVSDPDSSNFTFTVSNITHGTFELLDGETWTTATAFTTADLNAGHVRFVHDGGEAAPTFSISADDGAGSSHLSNVLPGTIEFVNVNDAPVITAAALAVAQGGTVLITLADVGITDPDSSSFTYYATATHGTFEIYDTETGTWVAASAGNPVTSAEIAAGHVHFHHDGSSEAPEITVVVSDGSAFSDPFTAAVDFMPAPVNTVYHLTSTDGTSIDVASGGATNGFVFSGGGNVTTPGDPEDRIVLGYSTDGGETHIIRNSSPMEHQSDFSTVSHHLVFNSDGSDSVVTKLADSNGVTLTQTITLGSDANFFTTTIDIFNGGTSTLSDVRFMRNFDPDQDVQTRGTFYTSNDVIHNPLTANDVAIVSAKGALSGAEVAMIGLNGDWRASSYGFTNTNPYASQAYDAPADPNGAQNDQAISLAYQFGSIAAGGHATTTYITTANVATEGSNALYGTDCADSINGLGGNDLLIGLGGADTFVFTAQSGHDTIYDFQNSIDHIDVSAVVATNDISTWMTSHVAASPTGAADTLITLDGGDTILLHNVAHTSLHASDFIVQPHSV